MVLNQYHVIRTLNSFLNQYLSRKVAEKQRIEKAEKKRIQRIDKKKEEIIILKHIPDTSRVFFSIHSQLYYLSYRIVYDNVGFNPEVYNGSHEALILKQINDLVSTFDLKKTIDIRYNLNSESTFLLQVCVDKLSENEFMECVEEKTIEDKMKEKIYKTIQKHRSISQEQLTQATRFIKDSEQRLNMLDELCKDSLIKIQIDETGKRKKRIYSAI